MVIPPLVRGEFVWLSVEGREPLRAMIGIASANGASLIVLFDGILLGHLGAMPLSLVEAGAPGEYRSLFNPSPVHLSRECPGYRPDDAGACHTCDKGPEAHRLN